MKQMRERRYPLWRRLKLRPHYLTIILSYLPSRNINSYFCNVSNSKKHLFNKNLSGLSPLCVPRKRAVPLFYPGLPWPLWKLFRSKQNCSNSPSRWIICFYFYNGSRIQPLHRLVNIWLFSLSKVWRLCLINHQLIINMSKLPDREDIDM